MPIERDSEWLAMCNHQASELTRSPRGRYWDAQRIGQEAADITDAIFRQRDARDVEEQAGAVRNGSGGD